MWLRKIKEEEEHDGRVVAVLKEEVRAGEELCNSNIDIELPYAQRQRELAEYGFACTCHGVYGMPLCHGLYIMWLPRINFHV